MQDKIIKALRDQGFINDEQLATFKNSQGTNENPNIIMSLYELGYLEEEQIRMILNDPNNIELFPLDDSSINDKILRKFPKELLIKQHVLPYEKKDTGMNVLCAQPLSPKLLQSLKNISDVPYHSILCHTDTIDKAINKHYAKIELDDIIQIITQAPAKSQKQSLLKNSKELTDSPIISLLNAILRNAYYLEASDIHIEASKASSKIRLRIDGNLNSFLTLEKRVYLFLVNRIKIMADLDIARSNTPQDGHFEFTIDAQTINIRISIIPTIHGEKIALRLLNTNHLIANRLTLGMDAKNYQKMTALLTRPHGILYFCGPTGCGKTTTLYLLLEELAKRNLNIMSIEDPVERTIDQINQTQIHQNLTFELGLKAILRQDPNVIMVGETRDLQTAETSLKAAISGHLVLSSLHTFDALSAFMRLKDMGVASYIIANAISGCIAQRLVKRICPHCKKMILTSEKEKALLSEDIEYIYYGEGCKYCHQSGYIGRIAIHELIAMDDELRMLINKNAPISTMKEYMINMKKFNPLKQQLQQLVIQGDSTMAEFNRLIEN